MSSSNMEKDPFNVEPETGPNFKRTLTASNLIALGVGAIIGTGIFVLTGTAAANHAGPALVLSFILSGLGCAFAGLCYAEFASLMPSSGSAYAYAKSTLGQFIAWIIGWDLILEYLFGASTVAVGWSGYFVKMCKHFGFDFPEKLCNAPLTFSQGHFIATGQILNIPAMFIIAMITILLVVGIKESARFNNIIVLVKLAVILLFIFLCASYVIPANWHPFIPAPEVIKDAQGALHNAYGIKGIVSGAAVIFFAYIGFDAVSTVAQEAKNPQRDMPIGILVSLLICTILYIAVSLVMTGIVPFKQLNVPAPIAEVIEATIKRGSNLGWLQLFTEIGAIAGLSSVVLVMLLGQPRIFYAMSKDGLLPKGFSAIHSKFGTPHVTTILTGSVAMIVAGLFPIGLLGELVSIGTLLAFVIVCVGIIVLRRQRPDMVRPFKTPLVPLVPILGAGICLYQMYELPQDTWIRLIVWMGIGFIIYFTYSIKNVKRIQANKVNS